MMESLSNHAPVGNARSPGSVAGTIEVICGSMFSGKTQELIRRLRLCGIARQRVEVFNSAFDTRYGRNHIISHDLAKIPSHAAKTSQQVLEKVDPATQVVGIDEVHFFDEGIIGVCEVLANQGRRVIVAGLDQDYKGEPFLITARLMAVAEFVTKNLAVCVVCGSPANKSQRLTHNRKRIEVGAGSKYEARCRRCFER